MSRPSVKIDFLVSNSRRRNEGRLKSERSRLVLSLLVVSRTKGDCAFILLEFDSDLDSDLDLDLDSTRVHVDALDHTPTPFLYVEGRCLCLLPGESRSVQVFLDSASFAYT